MEDTPSLLMSGEIFLKSYMDMILTNKRIFVCTKTRASYNYIFLDKVDSIEFSLKHKPLLIVIGSVFLINFIFSLIFYSGNLFLALFGVLGIFSLIGYLLTRKNTLSVKSANSKIEVLSKLSHWDELQGFTNSISEAREKILFHSI